MAWIIFIVTFMLFAWVWHLYEREGRAWLLWGLAINNLIAQAILWREVYLTKQWTTWVWVNLIVIGIPLVVVIAALLIVLFSIAFILCLHVALTWWAKRL